MNDPRDPLAPAVPAAATTDASALDVAVDHGATGRERHEGREHHEEGVLPVVEERLVVDKRVHDSIVRVSTRTRSEDVEVDETLVSLKADVQRVPVERFVDAVPQIEERDGVTVIPVVEEVLVKRLLLREELHVTQRRDERQHRETVTLRTQDPVVERLPADGSPPDASSDASGE